MVRYHASSAAIAASGDHVKRVLVIGTIETLQSQANDNSFVAQTITLSSTTSGAPVAFTNVNTVLLKHAINTLNPTTDAGASANTFLVRDDGVEALHVSFFALPTLVSRSNTMARPHAIHKFIKDNKSLSNQSDKNEEISDVESLNQVALVVFVLPNHEQTWFAAGAAVARAGHHYFHKGKKMSGVLHDNAQDVVNTLSDQLSVVYENTLTPEQGALLQHTADSIQLAVRLTDAPPNELHTNTFIAEAGRVAKRTGAKITVIQGEELQLRGLGGIYGVGKAAVNAPALVILSHYPASTTEPGIVLVGKGIVYDTGGLSVKTTGSMVGMKRDMGGAAGLLGAFQAAVLAKNTTNLQPLHVVLCVAENSIGPVATRPDDVHTFYSGKTVEINNTDAEGRLVLADGVAYAVKHLNPKVLIDMATLTGAQGITTGLRHGAIYTNNEDLEHLAVVAGKQSGDLCHPVPYAPEFYRLEFKSTIADMKNSVKCRTNAQVSCAGQFIANHLGEYEQNGKWLHIDMAYPVLTNDDERATGFGVALIQSLLKEMKEIGW